MLAICLCSKVAPTVVMSTMPITFFVDVVFFMLMTRVSVIMVCDFILFVV